MTENNIQYAEPQNSHSTERSVLGFWVYLMTDLVSFSALFATYAVLKNNTFGGPSGNELFSLPFVLTETAILLTSSFTCGLAMLAATGQKKKQSLGWFIITFLFGLSFLVMELSEFHRFILEGNGPQRSAFLSSYFGLVGTHGLHIAVGLLWMAICIALIAKRGLAKSVLSKLMLLSMFWHFLDIVWIFILTFVYLMR